MYRGGSVIIGLENQIAILLFPCLKKNKKIANRGRKVIPFLGCCTLSNHHGKFAIHICMNLKNASLFRFFSVQGQNLKNDSREEVHKGTADDHNTREVSTDSPDNISHDFKKRQVCTESHIHDLGILVPTFSLLLYHLNVCTLQVSGFLLAEENEKGRLIGCPYQRHSYRQETCSQDF